MAVNLYRTHLFGALLRSPLPQRLLQCAFLAALGGLLWTAWGRSVLPGVADAYPLLYTNAATLLFWVVWFMGLVLAVPFAGRAWCGVCPVGFLSDRIGRVGLNLPWPRGFLSWAGILVVFLAGLGGVLFWNVHKSPHATAVFVGLAVLAATAASLVWKRAAFCRLFCPVGLVLSLYSRHGPLRVAPADAALCGSCRERGCTNRKPVWKRWDLGTLVIQKKIFRSGCPVALDPPTMDPAACLLCMECVRGCPRGNLGLFYGGKGSTRPLTAASATLLVLLGGLVSLALVRTWPALREGLVPGAVSSPWGTALWLGLALPAALFLAGPAAAWAGGKIGGRPLPAGPAPDAAAPGPPPTEDRAPSFGALARRALAPFVGPVLGAHAALALVKLNAKAGYLPYLRYDLEGASTYLAIHVAKTLPAPAMILPLGIVRWAALTCLALGLAAGLREAGRSWRGTLRPGAFATAAAGFALFAAFTGALVYHWLFAGIGGGG
jgi:polyferredoxin